MKKIASHIARLFRALFITPHANHIVRRGDYTIPQIPAGALDEDNTPQEVPDLNKYSKHQIPGALAMVALAIGISIAAGCKTSQLTVAYKSVAAVQAGVETGLTVWADHVVSKRIEIAATADPEAKATASAALLGKESKVRLALSSYQRAASIAQVGVNSAIKGGMVPTTSEFVTAAEALTQLISVLTK